jgi:hypothetical protein
MNLRTHSLTAPTLVALLLLAGCSDDPPSPGTGGSATGGSAGSLATGGAGSGGGGATSGGASAGGGAGGASGGATGGGGAAAGAATGGGPSYPPTFATFRTEVYPMCTGGLCHDLGTEHKFYFKDGVNLYMALTTHVSMGCNMPVITKGNPEQSALVKLLKQDCDAETLRMPFQKCWDGDPQDSDFCVRPPLVAALEQWIRNGAPEN